MSKNLYIHATDSKSHAERGSPNSYASIYGVPFRPEDFVSAALPVSDATAEASIAMHEQWARNWVHWNLFCKECYELMRPFSMFPLELAQQYFSFIFGMKPCVSELVGEKQASGNGKPGPTPRTGPVNREQREQIAEAFDVAIGATTEMWAEVIHVDHGRAVSAAA